MQGPALTVLSSGGMQQTARVLLALALLALISASMAAVAQADPGEATIVQWRAAGASYGPFTAWWQATIPPTDDVHEATPVAGAHASYRWIEHLSGPQACAFTARPSPDGAGLVEIGGGRDCTHPGASCGYFMPGWTIYLASGRACDAFGVPECTGICW